MWHRPPASESSFTQPSKVAGHCFYLSGPLRSRGRQRRVALTIDNRGVDLLADKLDVAIRIGPPRDSKLIARRSASLELWTCASAAYLAARATPTKIEALAGHKIISRVDRKSVWSFRKTNSASQEFEFMPGTVVPEPAVIRKIQIGGSGTGRLPDFHAEDAIADGRRVRVPAQYQDDRVAARALYPSHRSLSAKVRVFIDARVAHCSRTVEP